MHLHLQRNKHMHMCTHTHTHTHTHIHTYTHTHAHPERFKIVVKKLPLEEAHHNTGFSFGLSLNVPAEHGECGCCYVLTQIFDSFSDLVNISCAQRLIHYWLSLANLDIWPFTFCFWEPSYALQPCVYTADTSPSPLGAVTMQIAREIANCFLQQGTQHSGLVIGCELSMHCVD